MNYIDLRYAFLLVINILKSVVAASPWIWDPFDITSSSYRSISKIPLILTLLIVFCFTSIAISPKNMKNVRLRIRDHSTTLTMLFVASLLFPQLLFWYAYFFLIFASTFSTFLVKELKSFLRSAAGALVRVPALYVAFSAIVASGEGEDDDGERRQVVEWFLPLVVGDADGGGRIEGVDQSEDLSMEWYLPVASVAE